MLDQDLLNLTHEQQQAAVEKIQQLMAEGIILARQFKLSLLSCEKRIKLMNKKDKKVRSKFIEF